MVAIAGDLVIGPGDVPIGVDRYGTTEAVTHKVHAIADRIVIRNKFSKGPEVGNHDVRADPNPLGVHAFDLGWCQTIFTSLYWMRACKPLDVSSWALRWIRTRVRDYAILHGRAALRFALPMALEIDKEEQTIFLDRSTQGAAEIVPEQLGRRVGLTTLQFSQLDKVIVGAGGCVAMRLEERAMEVVRAALGYKGDLCSRRAPLVRVVVRGGHPELLHGILGNRQDGSESVSFEIRVDVHAIQRDIALVASCTIHGATSRIRIFIDIWTVSRIGDAGLQREQFGYVAGFQGEFLDLVLAKGIAQGRVRRIESFRLSGNFHGLDRGPDFQLHVRGSRRIHQEL